MSIVIDVETIPIPVKEIPKANYEYLVKKSENKRSGKIIDGENYGNGAIGKFELNKIICCCIKKDDEDIISYINENINHKEDEKFIISGVFEQLVTQDHIITFNGNSFDLPMLKMRGLIHGLHTTMPFNIKQWSEHYIDVRYQLTDKYGVGDLAYWSRVFGVEPPQWGEDMDKSDLNKYPIADVAKACRDDVRCTYELYQKLNNSIKGE